MQGQAGVGHAGLGRGDDRHGADRDGVELAVEAALPEVEEAVQHRVVRKKVLVLPDVALQEGRIVDQPAEHLASSLPGALTRQSFEAGI